MKFFIQNKYWLSFYALSVTLMMIMCWEFSLITGVRPGNNEILITAKYVGEAVFLTSYFWLVSPKWRGSIVLSSILVATFFLINIWYQRFWGDLIPMSGLILLSNVDELVINSLVGSGGVCRCIDLIFIVPIILQVVFLIIFRNKLETNPFIKSIKFTAALSCLAAFFATQAFYTWSTQKWVKALNYYSDTSFTAITKMRLNVENEGPIASMQNNGLFAHWILMIAHALDAKNVLTTLNKSDVKLIESYIDKHSQIPKPFTCNKPQNIIFIIVESLNADIILKKVNGIEITPTLNSIVRADGTIYSTNVTSQIKSGCSSDGQLIYNTGLLPLKHVVTSLSVTPKVQFATLQELLGKRSSAAIFGDNGNSWGQTIAYKKFGFDHIIPCTKFEDSLHDLGADGAMFNYALSFIENLPQPFFLQLVTISMHVPFNDAGVSGFNDFDNVATLNEATKRYYRMARYFDSELGNFITQLKESHLYENSILVIASDHSQKLTINAADNIIGFNGFPIVFIAANTGMTKQITKPVGQIDVFPTILQIAGVENPKFAGVGTSMLDSINHTDMETAQKISELILRGNYFGSIKD